MKGEELVYGFHAVSAVIETAPGNVLELWVDPERGDARMSALIRAARHAGLRTQQANARTLTRKARTEHHQGVVARFRRPAPPGLEVLDAGLNGRAGPALLLALDQVTDPHNLGACLRVAEAAGAQAVVAPRRGSATVTPAVRAVAAGSAERVPFVTVNNLARSLRELQSRGLWIYGLAGDGESSIYDLDLRTPCVLVAGSEGRGLRRMTRERCDRVAAIPMQGAVESLNASVAAGVALFEARRQRLAQPDTSIAPTTGLK